MESDLSIHAKPILGSELAITRPQFGEEEIVALRQVLDSGWVTQGPLTAQFENLFAQRHQVPHDLATTSCTAALHLAVMALDIKAGDKENSGLNLYGAEIC
jgi:perosamine synthetase